jgi:hypothetical protein
VLGLDGGSGRFVLGLGIASGGRRVAGSTPPALPGVSSSEAVAARLQWAPVLRTVRKSRGIRAEREVWPRAAAPRPLLRRGGWAHSCVPEGRAADVRNGAAGTPFAAPPDTILRTTFRARPRTTSVATIRSTPTGPRPNMRGDHLGEHRAEGPPRINSSRDSTTNGRILGADRHGSIRGSAADAASGTVEPGIPARRRAAERAGDVTRQWPSGAACGPAGTGVAAARPGCDTPVVRAWRLRAATLPSLTEEWT